MASPKEQTGVMSSRGVSVRDPSFGNFSEGHKASRWQSGEEKASWQFLEGGTGTGSELEPQTGEESS